jgi:hypothetical protein
MSSPSDSTTLQSSMSRRALNPPGAPRTRKPFFNAPNGFEQRCRSPQVVRRPHNCADLEIPVNLGFDLLKFSDGFKGGDVFA